MKKLLSVLVLFLFAFGARAEIKIDIADRVDNTNAGHCMWAAVETLGRHHHIEATKGLLVSKLKYKTVEVDGKTVQQLLSGATWPRAVTDELRARKIKYNYYTRASYDELTRIANKQGAIVSLSVWWLEQPVIANHAIVVTRINKDGVQFVDSNDTRYMWLFSETTFRRRWTGYILTIPPQ